MFALDIFETGLPGAMVIALAAGFVSFISPCVLPVVPAYVAYMSGTAFSELPDRAFCRRTAVSALFFVLGLSTIFVLLGLAATAVGTLFLANQVLLGQIAGCVVILFGLHFVGLVRIPILNREFRPGANLRGGGFAGAYFLGLAFAFGWTPCIGPVLGAILALASQEQSLGRGAFLLLAYAMGLGIPFLLAGIFIGRSRALINRAKPHLPVIEKTIGAFLVLIGALLLTGRFSDLSYWLLEALPWLAVVG